MASKIAEGTWTVMETHGHLSTSFRVVRVNRKIKNDFQSKGTLISGVRRIMFFLSVILFEICKTILF